MPDPINADELTLDNLFEDNQPAVVDNQPQTDPATTQEPQAQPSEPYLRSTDGSVVYNSKEEALRGYEEKNRTIEQLRQTMIALHGYDPISGKPVKFNPYNQQEEVNYTQDPERLYDDLAAANAKGDKRAYATVMQKLMYDTYGPVMTQSAKAVTLNSLERKIPGITAFVDSDEYKQYLVERPLLKQAVEAAEVQPGMQAQLADLYTLAREGSSGRSLPEVLKSARQTASPSTTQTSQQARPTLQPTSHPVAQTNSVNYDLSTPEGRKAIIDAGRARGVDKGVLF